MTDERKEREEEREEEIGFGLGLGAIFKAIEGIMGSVGQLTDLAKGAATDAGETTGRMTRIPGIPRTMRDVWSQQGKEGRTGLFGFSVRTLDTGEPKIEPFGNIRPTPKGPVIDEVREPIVDIFEEEDHIQVVAELPGAEEQEVSYEAKGDVLTISSRGRRKYSKEITLPSPVDASDIQSTCKNGVLELKLKRAKG